VKVCDRLIAGCVVSCSSSLSMRRLRALRKWARTPSRHDRRLSRSREFNHAVHPRLPIFIGQFSDLRARQETDVVHLTNLPHVGFVRMKFPVFGYDFNPATRTWARCSSTGRHLTPAENRVVDLAGTRRCRRRTKRLHAPNRARAQ